MPYRSNAAEAWDPDPPPAPPIHEIPIDLLPPPQLTRPLWKSLSMNVRDAISPEKFPPLQLTSRPVDVGMLIGDRLSLPWFRTVFTNVGDVITPEALPPLELESRPVDVGELITDQLSHLWWSSLLRNLADRVAPEKLPALDLTAKPVTSMIPAGWIFLPAWSEVISTPKVFYPDKPKSDSASSASTLKAAPLPVETREFKQAHPLEAGLLRDLRRSKIRHRVWIGLAAAQIGYLVLITFWLH